MNRNFSMGIALLVLSMGCAAFESLPVREQKYGKAIPTIHQSFASNHLRSGDTWKLYLNASDPDGDMDKIVYTVDHQLGGGANLVGSVRIKKENRREVSGFLFWNTWSAYGLDISNIKLTVQIQDMAGHLSAPVFFPLTLQRGNRQENPPADTFKNETLGAIMISIRRDPFFGYPQISY